MLDYIKKKKIGKHTYQIELLPAKAGFSMAMKLSKVLIPLLGSGFDAFEEDSEGGFTRMSLIVVEQMEQVDMAAIVDDLLEGMAVNGQTVNFDDHFRANYGELVEVITFAMKENFSSFFEAKGLTARFSEIKNKMLPAAPQPEESND